MIVGETRTVTARLTNEQVFEVTAVTVAVYNAATGAAVAPSEIAGEAGTGWAGGSPEGDCYGLNASFRFTPSADGDYLWSLTAETDGGEVMTAEGVLKVLPAPPSLPAYRIAKSRVRIEAEAGTFPCLSDDDIDELLADAAIASVWSASTTYAFGVVVAPVVGNGTLWRALVAGTSGTTEPTWPALCEVGPAYGHVSGVTDGTLSWGYAGRAPSTVDGLWDVRQAVSAGWARKAGRALELEQAPITDSEGKVTIPNQAREREQVRAHCIAMADRNAPLFVR